MPGEEHVTHIRPIRLYLPWIRFLNQAKRQRNSWNQLILKWCCEDVVQACSTPSSLEGWVPDLPKTCAAGSPSDPRNCSMCFQHIPVLLNYSESVSIVCNQSTLAHIETMGNIGITAIFVSLIQVSCLMCSGTFSEMRNVQRDMIPNITLKLWPVEM